MKFNEDTRVKIPTILHLIRLGYQYLSLKGQSWDLSTNIFPDLFFSAITRINSGIEADDVSRLLEDMKLLLDNEDLGRAFEKLTDRSNTKLIDFENFNNNSFHVVTELTCQNGDEEFRPDITLLINGMPLAFIEVKKPNNREGVLAERDRINKRFQNPKFKRFANIKNLLFDAVVSKYYVSTPPSQLAKLFFEFVAPLEKKKQILRKENSKLAALRDWLLPMLMNGQVTIAPTTQTAEA